MKPKDDDAYVFERITARLTESPNLGLGELASPEMATWIARSILFHFVEKLAQKELRELQDLCREPFDELCSEGGLATPIHELFPHIVIRTEGEGFRQERIHYIENWGALMEAAAYSPAADALRCAMVAWAKQHNLASPWVLEAAWRLLCVWSQSCYANKDLVWALPSIFGVGPDGARIVSGIGFAGNNKYRPHLVPPGICAEVPTLPRYDPVGMTRSEYLKRVHKLAAAYCKLQEAGYRKLGLIRAPRMRAKSGSPWVHWAWFVKYQIKKLTAGEIANERRSLDINESAISAGVRKVGRLVGLPLRPKSPRRATAGARRHLR